MGSTSREKPQRLAEKLLQIRLKLNLSQNEMLRYIGLEEKLIRSDISKYERGVREPSLLVLLAYAKSIGISTDVLIDDERDLPE
jgi:transcriptional regulator with XRE-family HTH domain